MTTAARNQIAPYAQRRIGAVPLWPGLAERQAEFAKALLDSECPIPHGLIGLDGRTSVKRFNVYRNNVVAGLIATLKDAFPVIARIVGEEFFLAMARFYVTGEPPKSPIMLAYGEGFARFVGEFEPAQALPYLQDVARIERAWVEAYHAPEAYSLDPAAFGSIDINSLPHGRFALHPSLRLVQSPFPAFTLWQMNIEGGTPEWVDLDGGGEDVLIIRPEAEVEVRQLPPGGASFVRALADGLCVLDAMEIAMAADHRFDLTLNLTGLISAKTFIGFDVSANTYLAGGDL